MDIKGKLLKIEQKTEGVSKAGKAWTKQEFLIETIETYPKKIYMETMKEPAIETLSKSKIGDTVTCGINIESREFNGRWYSSISAWKIFREGASSSGNNQDQDPEMPF